MCNSVRVLFPPLIDAAISLPGVVDNNYCGVNNYANTNVRPYFVCLISAHTAAVSLVGLEL